jgi:hypothetical protein
VISSKGLTVIVALVAVFCCALSGLARAHDQYMDWKQPGTEISCCHDRDCYDTESRFEHGQWYALRREDRRWIAIPEKAVLKDGATPDGKAHLCAPAPITEDDSRIYCFRPPFMGG